MIYRIEETSSRLSPAEQSEAARRLLAAILAERYAIDPLPGIGREESGKPVLIGEGMPHFSLSHCSRGIMVAVDDRPVGCDIEEIVDDCPPGLLEVAFSDGERNRIVSSPDPRLELTRLWTRKEAMVKRSGDIADDPRLWPSDGAGVTTTAVASRGYVFSIAVTESD